MNQNELNKKSHKVWYIGAVAVIVIVALFCAFFIWNNIRSKHYTVYMEDAQKYVSAKEYDRAIASYKSAIEVDKKQIRPYEGLGEVYVITQQYSQARMILRQGYEITGSERLNQMYVKLDGLVDGMDDMNIVKDDLTSGEGSGGLWNDDLISMLSSFTYKEYKKEYGNGQISESGNSLLIQYKELNATAYYQNSGSKNVVDIETGNPYDGAIPSYIIFHDLTTVFYDSEDMINYEEISRITGTEPEIQKGKQGWKIIFQYMDCEFTIESDENGNIQNQYAANRVVPLKEGVSKSLGEASGNVVDATTGNGIGGVHILLQKEENGEIISEDISNDAGEFSVQAESGNYTMTFEADGYVTEATQVTISNNLTEDLGVKALSPNLEEGEWRIVLEWGAEPADLDAHLVTDNYHVSFANPNGSAGEEKANLDVDDQNGEGPETITISGISKDRTYQYYVHDFTNGNNGNSSQLAESGAVVKVYMPNGEILQYNVPSGKGTLWNVLEISDGKVTEINEITSELSSISK